MRAVHRPNGSLPPFSSQRHSNCSTGSIGSVCARQHTRWSHFPLCIAPNSNRVHHQTGYHHCLRLSAPAIALLLIAILQRLDSSSWCSSLRPSALKLVSPPSAASSHSSLQFCVVLIVSLHQCSVLVRLTSRRAPQASLPPLLGVAASPAHSSAPRMSACRTRPAANLGGPQGGAQTGRSPGGGWTEAEPPALRNQMLRGIPPPRQDRFRLSERTRRDTHTGD